MKDQEIKETIVKLKTALALEEDEDEHERLFDELYDFESAHWERIVSNLEYFDFYMLDCDLEEGHEDVWLCEKMPSGKWCRITSLKNDRPDLLVKTVKGLMRKN